MNLVNEENYFCPYLRNCTEIFEIYILIYLKDGLSLKLKYINYFQMLKDESVIITSDA